MTTATKPKKPPKLFETTCDSSGKVQLHLSKPVAKALVAVRDYCHALSLAAPTVSSQARGIHTAINRLLSDIAAGPMEPAEGFGDVVE